MVLQFNLMLKREKAIQSFGSRRLQCFFAAMPIEVRYRWREVSIITITEVVAAQSIGYTLF